MIRRRMAATTPLVLALLLLAFVLVALSLGDRAIARMAAETLIRVTLVVGFWIFVGNSGVVSFGHAAFACIGAYVSAWATPHTGTSCPQRLQAGSLLRWSRC